MSEIKKEVNKIRFWTPLRLACTVIALALLATFGVSSCNSNDPSVAVNRSSAPTRPASLSTLPRTILETENRAASGDPIKLANYSGKVMLVNLWATWCGPCRMFAPVYEAASEQHTDIVFGKVDTEAEQQLAGAARITSIPTLMAFREGILVFAQPGALPAPALEQLIAAVRGLDMADVRRQLEADNAETAAG